MRNATVITGVCHLVLVLVLLPPSVLAQSGGENRAFGFGAREIYEFKNGTSRLHFHDINRDGRADILFLNNHMSRIEVLIRKALDSREVLNDLPTLADAFDSRGFLLDQKTMQLEVRDLNGDQRPDILTAGAHRGLRTYFQDSEGRFDNATAPAVKHPDQMVQVATADFDNDGAADILVCRRTDAVLLYNDGRGRFQRRLRLNFTAPECEGVMIGDYNGDGCEDILLSFPEEQLPLRLFMGRSEGGFGWEHPLDTPPLKAFKKISLLERKADQLLAILSNAVNIRHYELVRETSGGLWEAPAVTADRMVARGVGAKLPLSWAVADFNQDGLLDYGTSAPELSGIMLHFGSDRGIDPVAREISSLRRIETLGVDDRGDLYVFSPEEDAIACHPAGAFEAFPAFVDLEGSPLLMDVSPRGRGFFTIVKRKRDRLYFCWGDRSGLKRAVAMDIPANQPPDAMRVFPVSPNRWGVVLFSPLKKPTMHLWTGRKLAPVSKSQLRALGAGLTPADISMVGTRTAPGIMISEGQAARLYRYDGRQFAIERQFSLPDENAVLKFGVSANGPAGSPGYLFYNKNGNELCWFPRSDTGDPFTLPLADGFPGLAGIVPVDGPNALGFLLPGKAQTRWVGNDAAAYVLKTISGYTSRAEDPKLWNFYPLKLGSPPIPMVAALDAKNASIELLSARGGQLTEEVSFKVFQGPQFNRDDKNWFYEPREVASGDLNADGLMDLGILVHDKLLIHLGE